MKMINVENLRLTEAQLPPGVTYRLSNGVEALSTAYDHRVFLKSSSGDKCYECQVTYDRSKSNASVEIIDWPDHIPPINLNPKTYGDVGRLVKELDAKLVVWKEFKDTYRTYPIYNYEDVNNNTLIPETIRLIGFLVES